MVYEWRLRTKGDAEVDRAYSMDMEMEMERGVCDERESHKNYR